jgi:hypothetical protein
MYRIVVSGFWAGIVINTIRDAKGEIVGFAPRRKCRKTLSSANGIK